jgi:hypothetical protein
MVRWWNCRALCSLERAGAKVKDPRAATLATREVKVLEARGDTVSHNAMRAPPHREARAGRGCATEAA